MPPRCRMSDTGTGICPNHSSPRQYTTIFNIGATTVLTNNFGSANLGTVGISSCGHPTIALLGSSSVNIEGKPSHRIGDTGANFGTYIALIGSPNVNDGG